jgi:hypothetical protein
MHPFPTLQTNRLGLREITQDDAQDIFEIYSCAEVVRYYDCDAYESIEQALSQIQSWAANYSKDVAIRWGYQKSAKPKSSAPAVSIFGTNNTRLRHWDMIFCPAIGTKELSPKP